MNTTLQSFVDELIEEVYQWPISKRTTIRILQYIERKQRSFQSLPTYGCYYIQLAQIIDHFLQEVTTSASHTPDLSWFCKYWETTDQRMKLERVVIEQKTNQLVFKKYVLEPKDHEFDSFRHSAIHCSKHMFQTPPDRIEMYHLLTGESQVDRVSKANKIS